MKGRFMRDRTLGRGPPMVMRQTVVRRAPIVEFAGYTITQEGEAHPTQALFQVYAHKLLCNPENGERIALRTSIPNIPYVQLDPHPAVAHFWQCQVPLPFREQEQCPTGLMEYQFFVVTNDGSMIPEEAPVVGMRSRIMTRVERYICADIALPSEDERTLRLAEFRKGKSVASSFVKFAKLLVHEYVSGRVPVHAVLRLFQAIGASFPTQFKRVATESFVDDMIKEFKDRECPEEFPYIIAGICGVATRIRESRNEDVMTDMPDGVDDFDMGRMTDRYMSSSMMGRMTDRHVDVDVPTSTAWCANVLSRINLKQFFLMPKAYFGRFDSQDVRFMVDGINEAVNRMSRPESANYSLEWVLFTPILMREGIAPHVQFPSHMQPQLTAMFNSLKENLLSEINQCFSKSNQEFGSAWFMLGQFWLRALIRYAPSLSCLAGLFQPNAGCWIQLDQDTIIIHQGKTRGGTVSLNSYQSNREEFHHCVVMELASWLTMQMQVDDSNLALLAQLITVAPILGCPRIGSTLILHSTANRASLKSLMQVLSLCAVIPNRGPTQMHVPAQTHAEELHHLNDATQKWFNRFHGESTSVDLFESGMDVDISRLIDSLKHSITVVDAVLRIEFFGRNANGILYQLLKCAPLQRDSHTVLHVIGGLAHATNAFAGYSDLVQNFMRNETEKLVRQLLSTQNRVVLAQHLMSSFGESLMCDELLNSMVTEIAQQDSPGQSRTTLVSLLRNVDFWLEIFTRRGVEPNAWRTGAKSTLRPLAVAMIGHIQSSFLQIGKGSLNLRELRILRKEKEAVVRLMQCLAGGNTKQIAANTQLLTRALATLAEYELLTNHISCYVNSYGSCGAEFDVHLLKERMKHFVDCERRSSLTLQQITDCFAEDIRPFGTSLAWLYELRDSVLLRHSWTTIEAHRADMTQQLVIAELIPAVKQELHNLWTEIHTQKISVERMRSYFGVVLKQSKTPDCDGSNECCSELDLMNLTGNGMVEPAGLVSSSKLDELKRNVRDFVLVDGMGQWLPSLLKISNLLSSLFQARSKQSTAKHAKLADTLKEDLTRLEQLWTTEWAGTTLATVHQMATSFTEALPAFTVLQMNFLLLLSKCEALVHWMLTQADETDFNRLLQVCRSCTEDALVHSSMASLIYVRTLLLKFLFPAQPYADTKEMLFNFRDVDVEGLTGYSHLQNLEASFVTLKSEMFDKQTRSDGIKAFMDLNELRQSSQLVIQLDDTTTSAMTLHLETKGADGKIKMESIHYLQDLRSKLLITDVPEQLESELGMTAMRDAFATQLQILIEIRDQVLQLQTLGHFEFQTYVSHWRFDVAQGLVPLLAERKRLSEATLSWTQMVSAVRSKSYFLNYFTMRELLHLATVFSSLNGAQFDAAAVADVCAHLHLISSKINAKAVGDMMKQWKNPAHGNFSAQEFMELFGVALENLFQHKDTFTFATRTVPTPGLNSTNRHDMLINMLDQQKSELESSGSNSVPLYCAVTSNSSFSESEGLLASVLSIYVRRGRLPEPGEVLFCSSKTTAEDIELLLRRFIRARLFGRKEAVFVLANVQSLSYAVQSVAVSILRDMLSSGSQHRDASILVMLSAKPAQLLLTAFSAQSIELPALDINSIRNAMENGAVKHNGPLTCVASSINGGGKSDYIMRHVAQTQVKDKKLIYRRIFIRESTGADALVTDLLTSTAASRAIHIDIGHITPESANVTLFELLIVGVLKSSSRVETSGALSRVYHRDAPDCVYVEIPNSVQDKTRRALRVLSFFHTTELAVNANSLKLDQPRFVDNSNCTQLQLVARPEITFVGKMLRAIQNNALKPGADGKMTLYIPDKDAVELNVQDCFNLFVNVCSPGMPPNWTVMASFLKFMTPAFRDFVAYSSFLNMVCLTLNNAETKQLKHVYAVLLLETSKDFSIRSVPRSDENAPSMPAAQPNLLLRRTSSGSRSSVRRLEQAAAAAPDQARELMREQSDSAITRFGSMKQWHDTDHPVVVWQYNQRGEPSNAKILSLNPQYLMRFMSKSLVDTLTTQGFRDLNKDWRQMTSAEGEEIIRSVHLGGQVVAAGAGGDAELPAGFVVPPITPGYVITIDNMMKMLSVELRLRNHMPVVIMGETGCGKSSLVNSMCSLLKVPLFTLNIHGGMEDSDILHWMLERVELARKHSNVKVVVFLDEVNTCNSMCLFKEIICDRSINGMQLPSNMDIIAACNPYRRKQGLGAEQEKSAGLLFSAAADENVGSGITDPLKDLVYRVHPLPESLTDFVFDFGALQASTEQLYIKSMIGSTLPRAVVPVPVFSAVPAAAAPAANGNVNANAYVQINPEFNAFRLEVQRTFTTMLRDNPVVKALWDEHQATYMQRQRACAGQPNSQRLIAEAGQQCSTAIFEAVMNVQEALEPNSAAVMVRLQQMISPTEIAPDADSVRAFIDVFSELVCASQEFVRRLHGGERSVCSLRDVARCLRVFSWFGRHFVKTTPGICTEEDFFGIRPSAFDVIRQAVIMALSYCYMSRLPGEDRAAFRKCVSDKWLQLQQPIMPDTTLPTYQASRIILQSWFGLSVPKYGSRCSWLRMGNPNSFQGIVTEVQRSLVTHMRLPDGIALNDALLENLFMILVSILNRFPIFIIGKPGSSKSLAMQLVQSNLRGKASDDEVLRTLPAVEVFSYQCSPLSTSAGIQQVFETAARYEKGAPNSCVVVLLDEVGLAEQSPHLPLKVLHKILDENSGGSVVGISNWSLDPAKMNRAAHLYRPAPTVQDLSNTAEGMVRSVNLKGYLQSLAAAYFNVYHMQTEWGFEDFWGLREFYSTIKAINRHLRQPGRSLDAAAVMSAVQRNFGGRPEVMRQVIETFFASLNLGVVDDIPMSSVVQLIEQNIFDPDARHLMVLTKNNVALGALFDLQRQMAVDGGDDGCVPALLTHAQTEVIFGSEFPMDQNDLQISLNLQKIKTCMATGKRVVLVHCEQLYESLYDLLNQHYISVKSQNFVRIAFGSHSRLCPIHQDFRIVCIVETNDAYQNLAPPFLNRFEKQVLERKDLILPIHQAMTERLRAFVQDLLPKTGLLELQSTFCGYHADTIASVVQAVIGYSSDQSQHQQQLWFRDAVHRLFWIAQPEAICRVIADTERCNSLKSKHHIDVRQIYFDQQIHADVTTLACNLLNSDATDVTVMTHAPYEVGLKSLLVKHAPPSARITLCSLHELTSERDLKKEVESFFSHAADPNVSSLFVLHCDSQSASVRRIQHARYIIDSIRARNHDRTDCRVLILLHLSRVTGGSYAFDFDRRWSYAYVDSVEPASDSGLLTLVDLSAAKSMSEIVSRLNLTLVLRRCFRAAVARLVYTYQRSVSEVRSQILFLLRRLRDHDDALVNLSNDMEEQGQSYLQIVQTLIANIVADSKMQLDMSAAVDDTFQAALHSQIDQAVVSSFAILLAEMDRNSNLRLLALQDDAVNVHGASAITDEQRQLSSIWLSLLPMYDELRAMKRDSLQLSARVADVSRQARAVDVIEDGAGGFRFVAQFPFSFYLAPIVHNMRVAAEMQPPEARVTFMQGMISKLNVPELFKRGTALSSSLIQRYVHDLIGMYVEHSASYTIDTEFAIVWRMLCLVGNCAGTQAEPTTLAAVHCRFWAIQQRVYHYLQLLQIVPAASNALITLLQNSHCVSLHLDCQVIENVINCHLESSRSWRSSDDYDAWLGALQQTAPRASALLAFSGDSADGALLVNDDSVHDHEHADLSSHFEALVIKLDAQLPERSVVFKSAQLSIDMAQFLGAFVRHICNQLKLEPKIALPLVQSLFQQSRDQLRSLATMQLLLQTLRTVYRKMTGAQAQTHFRHCASKVVESFVFETCFGGAEHELELGADLLGALVGLLATAAEDASGDYLNESSKNHSSIQALAGVLTLAGSRVALMRFLLAVRDPAGKASINKALVALLSDSAKKFGYLDSPVAVSFAIVQEELCVNAAPTLSAAIADEYLLSIDPHCLANGAPSDKPEAVRALLECISKTRHLLNLFAASIDSCFSSTPSCDRAYVVNVSARLSDILSVCHPQSSVTRPTALYLLKQLDRRRGDSFVRSLFIDPELGKSAWVVAWVQSGDVNLARFLGEGKLPRLNPLQTLPMWHEVSGALSSAMSATGNCAELENVAKANKTLPFKGALLGAVFHQIYMLQILSNVADVTLQRGANVRQWILSSASLNWLEPAERNLLHFFAGGECPANVSPEVRQCLGLHAESSSERILLVRLVVHFCACAMSVPLTHPLSLFRTMFTRPALLKKNPLPTMPEDEVAMAVKALGGRWYNCANGHPFYVDACGRPTEEIKCSTCGISIGGLHHRADHGITDLYSNLGSDYFQKTTAVDNSPSGYCVKRVADESALLLSVRGMPPIGMRFQRFCLHAALLLGCVATATGAHVEPLNSVVFARDLANAQFAAIEESDPATHFVRHLQADWNLAVQIVNQNLDNAVNVFHLALHHFCSIKTSEMVKMVDGQGFAVYGESGHSLRNQWEDAISTKVIKPMFSDPGIASRLNKAATMFQSSENDEGAAFVCEMRDSAELDAMSVASRLLLAPALWSYRQRFSMSDMVMELHPQLHPDTAQQYPVLSLVLSQESHVRGLRYMPQLFGWSNLLLNKYSRRLDRSSARSMTVASELNDAPDQHVWQSAFEAFRNAFNCTWRHVTMIECESNHNPDLLVDEQTSVALCLPYKADEGLYLSAGVAPSLGTLHNTIVALTAQRLGKHESSIATKPSTLFTSADSIAFDMSRFAQYVERHCVQVSANGSVSIDFAAAEQYLMMQYLSDKPFFKIESRTMVYVSSIDEETGARVDSDIQISRVSDKVEQQPLSSEVAAALLAEISSRSAQKSLLNLLETAVSLLQETGGNARLDVGSTRFVDFLESDLQMSGVEVRRALCLGASASMAPAFHTQLCLKHIAHANDLIGDALKASSSSKQSIAAALGVSPKYQKQLSAVEKSVLLQQFKAPELRAAGEEILHLMKHVMREFLTAEHTSETASIADMIGMAEVGDLYASELEWFALFPTYLLCSQFVTVYETIVESLTL